MDPRSDVSEHVEARKWLRAHYAKAFVHCLSFPRHCAFQFHAGFLRARGIHLSRRVSGPSFLLESYSVVSFCFFLFVYLHAATARVVAFRERVKRFFPSFFLSRRSSASRW